MSTGSSGPRYLTLRVVPFGLPVDLPLALFRFRFSLALSPMLRTLVSVLVSRMEGSVVYGNALLVIPRHWAVVTSSPSHHTHLAAGSGRSGVPVSKVPQVAQSNRVKW